VTFLSYRRWSETECAIRDGTPLPGPGPVRFLAVSIAAVGLLAAAASLLA
jgi:hypothetical protein